MLFHCVIIAVSKGPWMFPLTSLYFHWEEMRMAGGCCCCCCINGGMPWGRPWGIPIWCDAGPFPWNWYICCGWFSVAIACSEGVLLEDDTVPCRAASQLLNSADCGGPLPPPPPVLVFPANISCWGTFAVWLANGEDERCCPMASTSEVVLLSGALLPSSVWGWAVEGPWPIPIFWNW